MILNIESLDESLIDELEDILEENYEESGQGKNKNDDDELLIDWPFYLSMGDRFIAFILRDEDDNDEIVGILFFITGMYPHNYNLAMAQQVTFYINKDNRSFSKYMMSMSEDVLSKQGVHIIIQSARAGTGFNNTLKAGGYELVDNTYMKRIR